MFAASFEIMFCKPLQTAEPGTPPLTPQKEENNITAEKTKEKKKQSSKMDDVEAALVSQCGQTGQLALFHSILYFICSQEGDEDWQYQTLRRQRKFKFEGKEVTTETTRIIQVSEDQKQQKNLQDSKKYQQMRYSTHSLSLSWFVSLSVYRKQDLRELRLLQRSEMKEATEYYNKIIAERETQQNKFDQEKLVNTIITIVFFFLFQLHPFISIIQELETKFTAEQEELQKKQMKDLDRLEQQQLQEYKNKSKQMKSDQVSVFSVPFVPPLGG